MNKIFSSLLALSLIIADSGIVFAQVTYTFNNPGGGGSANWGDSSSWTNATSGTTPAGPPTATDIARFNNPAAYIANVNGSFTVRSLQIGSGQTGALNLRDPGGSGTRQIVLEPGVGANGSIPAFNGKTTLFAESGATQTTTIRPIVFLGGGAAGSPVDHVWEIQAGRTVDVIGQIQATASSGNTLTKAGAGTLILSTNNFGLNTWTGGLRVTGGTVLANGSLTPGPSFVTGNGPVTVSAGATLGGYGQINMRVEPVGQPPLFTTIENGGTLLAGTSAARPQFRISSSEANGGLDMRSGSTLGVKLFGTGATEISLVNVQGAAVIDTNRISLDLSGLSASQAAQLRQDVLATGGSRTYRVLTASESMSGTGFNAAGFTVSNLGNFQSASEWSFGTFDLNGDAAAPGGFVTLVFTPVPEPQAVLGVSVLVWSLAAVVRRARKRRDSHPSV